MNRGIAAAGHNRGAGERRSELTGSLLMSADCFTGPKKGSSFIRRRRTRRLLAFGGAIERLECRQLLSSSVTNIFPSQQYSVSGAPVAIATADFNHDGRMDAVSVDPSNGVVTVLLNNGDGTFTSHNYPAGSATSVAVGDLNGDSFPDLVLGTSTGINVLFNDGTGAFPTITSYPIGSGISAVAVGDFNGDHLPDVAFVNARVGIMLNTGGGVLGGYRYYAMPNSDTANILAVGDINGDGKSDVVAAAFGGTSLYVLPGAANGVLGTAATYNSNLSAISSLAVGDLNGDGKLDVVAANSLHTSILFNNGTGGLADGTQARIMSGSDQLAMGHLDSGTSLDLVSVSYAGAVLVQLNNGSGTFGAPIRSAGADTVNAIALADFNGDGLDDLITADGDGTVSVLLSRGNGKLQSISSAPVGGEVTGLISADFNGDGLTDLATINAGTYHQGNTVSILLNNGSGTFNNVSTYPVGNDPTAIVAGDFNGDGKMDLAVANYLDDTVSILINQGQGKFAAAATYSAGKGPYSIAVGDLNGDGKPDLVVADYSDTTVAVLLNNGSGLFSAPTLYQVGGSPNSVVVGDFNGDTSPDIAASVYSTGTVQVLTNNTRGVFTTGPTLTTGAGAYSLVAGNFDGNGNLDLAVLTGANGADIFLNNGAGGFNSPTTLAIASARSLVVGDINGDSHADLVATLYGSYGSPGIAVLLGTGTGTFSASAKYQPGSTPGGVALGDFNKDGQMDLAVANSAYDAGTISVLLGRGGGTLSAPEYYAVGSDPRTMATGDFNHDGLLDLVTANYNDDTISILMNNGHGAFNAPVVYGIGSQPTSIAVGFFNGDAYPDIVTANSNGTVSVLINTGTGVFANATAYNVGTSPVSVVAGNFNSDNKMDIAVANAGDSQIAVLINNGDGTFAAAVKYTLPAAPTALAFGDINGDGFNDLVVSSFSGNEFSVLLNNKDGTFSAPVNYSSGTITGPLVVGDLNGDGLADVAISNSGLGIYPATVAAFLATNGGVLNTPVSYSVAGNKDLLLADINNDGHPDLIAGGSSAYSQSVSVLLGNASGTFVSAPNAAAPSPVLQMIAGDFDGDGKLDLVTSNYGYQTSSNISLMFGTGTGGFVSSPSYSTSVAPRGIAIGDVNGDSKPDLITINGAASSSANSTISIILDSSNLFSSSTSFAIPGTPEAVAVGDFNGDHILDLAVVEYGTSNGSQNLLIFMGNGDGTFAAPVSYSAGANADALAVGDFNGDGHPDLAVVNNNYLNGSVTILLNNGDGAFSQGGSYSVGKDPVAIVAGNFSGDSKTDLAVVNEGSDNVTILQNTGGSFITSATLTVGSGPNAITAADFDGNGQLDLAVSNSLDKSVSVLFNNAGTFSPAVNYPLDAPANSISAGDFNGDGWTDLIVSSYNNDGIGILLNTGSGEFAAPQNYATGISAGEMVVGDFDGNGMPDAALTGNGADSVAILVNQIYFAAPANPPTVMLTTDTGDSDSDGFTQSTKPIFAGETYPFTNVQLFVDGMIAGTAAAGADGSYRIPLATALSSGPHSVTVQTGNQIGFSPLSQPLQIVVDTTAPTAQSVQFNLPAVAQDESGMQFAVDFSDNASVDPSSIHTGSVTVTLPDGTIVAPTLISIGNSGSSATNNVAYFLLSGPDGSFQNAAAYGTYTLNLVAGGFTDSAGNACSAAAIGSLVVTDTTPPTAVSSDFLAPLTNASSIQFTVTFSDNYLLDASTIRTGSVEIDLPDGNVVQPSLVSTSQGDNGSVVGLFEMAAPSGIFNATANGQYVLSVAVNGFSDTSGNSGAPGPIAEFNFTADVIPPVASTTDFVAPAKDATQMSFSVTYTDNVAVDVSSIKSGTLSVTIPDGSVVNPTIVSTTATGSSILVSYSMNAPGGVFNSAANGNYSLQLLAGGFADAAGNLAVAATIGAFTLNVDTIAPTVSVAPVTPPVSDQRSLSFTVSYIGNAGGSGIQTSTLGNTNILVTGPNGFSTSALLVSSTAITGGVQAVYEIPAPNGFFSNADNGTYTFTLADGSVSDRAGNFITGEMLGTVAVSLSPPPVNPDLTGSVTAPTSAVLPGSKKNSFVLTISNIGTDVLKAKVPAVIYASPTPNLDAYSAIPLENFQKGLKLNAGSSKSFQLRFSAPTNIGDGNYYLFAVLDPDNTITEQFKSNNSFASAGTVQFEAPVVDLSTSIISTPSKPVKAKAKAPIKILLTNNGNVTAKGSAAFALYGSPDQTFNPQINSLLTNALAHVSLKPGQSKRLTIKVTNPGSTPVNDFISATLNYTGAIPDQNQGNNLAFSNQPIDFG